MKSNANFPADRQTLPGDASPGPVPDGAAAAIWPEDGQGAGLKTLALWCDGGGRASLRPGAEGEGIACRALFSGVSRGTERLVFEGRVPESEQARMRAPSMRGRSS